MEEVCPICSVCHKSIPGGALYCAECSHYQGKQKWRNELKFWGGLTGVATLIAASVAVLVGFYQSVSSRFFGYDVYVVDFSTTDNLRLFNPSGNSVIVTSFQFRSATHGIDFLLPIAAVIDPGKPMSVNIPTQIRDSISGWNRNYLGDAVGNYVRVSGLFDFLVDQGEFPLNFYDGTLGFFTPSGIAAKNFSDKIVPDFMLLNGVEHRHLMSLNDTVSVDRIVLRDTISEKPHWFFWKVKSTPDCEAVITYATMPFGREGRMTMNCAIAYHTRIDNNGTQTGPT